MLEKLSIQTGGSPSSYISLGEVPGNKTPQDKQPQISYLPTPPTSPPKLKRKHRQSELDSTKPPYPPFKKRCLVPTRDNLPRPTLCNPTYRRRPVMTPERTLENETDRVAKQSNPANQRSTTPEWVNNNATAKTPPSSQVHGDITGSMDEGCEYISSSKGAPPISNLRPPKRRRFLEFDEHTGREIITERLQHPRSTSSESTRLVDSGSSPSSASRGNAPSSSSLGRPLFIRSTPLSGPSSEKPFRDLTLHTTVHSTGAENKVTIFKSPEPISQDSSVCGSLDEEDTVKSTKIISNTSQPILLSPRPNNKSTEEASHMGVLTQGHLMTPIVTRVPTPVTSCSTLTDSTIPLDSPNGLARSVLEEKKPVPSNVSYLQLNGEKPPVEFHGKGLGEATTPKLSEPIRQAVRRKPHPLPLAAQAGNFATLAGSRERRQPASIDTNNPIFKAPFTGSPTSYKSTKSVPVTPTSDTSRRSSYSRIGNDQAEPNFRPLSPVEPVGGGWLSHVPPEVRKKIIEKQAVLVSQNHKCAMPLHYTRGRKNRVKGKYRVSLETDMPNLQDFIIVNARDGTYCKKNANEAEDEDASVDMDVEEGFLSTGVERWSGGNVKGPKHRVLVEHLKKPMMGPSGGKLPDANMGPRGNGNLATSKVSSIVRSKFLNSTIVTRRRRNTTNGVAAITQAGNGIIKLKPLRNMSLSMEDEPLVEGLADLNYGLGSSTNVTGTRQINRMTIAADGSAATEVSILRPRPPTVAPGNYSLQLDTLTESLTSATESIISSDTEISSDEDIIPSSSLFGHRTARCASSSTSQSRALRKENQANAIRLTEGGPNGKGFVFGSTSIFSIGQLAAVGTSVMGPPAAKVSPAELRLYIGRRGDQVPLFGSGGKMIQGLGPISPHEYTTAAYDGHSASTSGLLQSGGVVEVRRAQDPLLEAISEVKRLIFEAGHQAGLVPEEGILAGLRVEKVYWSGEREASLNKPYSGIGVDFSGRPLVKAVTFVNPLSNHTYTLLFLWAFLPVNTPEGNKENAVGNSMLPSGEVKGDGAPDTRSDDVRESFQVHLCVGKPGRVQKKEDRKRVVFVQVVNHGKGGKGSKATSAMSSDSENIKWERWELDGLMRGLARLWLQNTQAQSKAGSLPRVLSRDIPSSGDLHAGSSAAADPIGAWLERDVLGLHGPYNANDNAMCSPKLQHKIRKVSIDNVARPSPMLPAVDHTSNRTTPQTPLPLYLQGPESDFSSGVSGGLPPPPAPPPVSLPSLQPVKVLAIDPYVSGLKRSEAVRRGKHRKKVLWEEMCREVLLDFSTGEIELEDQDFEDLYWWQV